MSLIMIEGFEQIAGTEVFDADKLEYLFLALRPDYIGGWLTDDAGCSINCAAGGRVANNCLQFTRSAGAGTFKSVYGVNLGFGFSGKNKVTVGFAVKFDTVPTESIPLLVMRYDNGAAEEEQVSLWATPTGRLYFSQTEYAAAYASMLSPVSLSGGMSVATALRYTVWNYIEVTVDYSAATPVGHVSLNGLPVIENYATGLLKKMTDSFISSVHFINPTNQHFADGAFVQSLDDIYISDGNMIGPQQVVPLDNETNIQLGTWSGVPPDGGYEDGDLGVSTSDSGTTPALWNLSNVSGIGTVNGVSVNVIMQVTSGIAGINFGVQSNTGTSLFKGVTATADDPPRCFRFVSDLLPSPLANSEAGVNALRGYLARRTI